MFGLGIIVIVICPISVFNHRSFLNTTPFPVIGILQTRMPGKDREVSLGMLEQHVPGAHRWGAQGV